MCGIAGAFNLTDRGRMAEADLERMTAGIVHRGPDDSGLFVDDQVAFGHRRLTILDLTTQGRQPMFDETGRAGIVYNGEIYNYLELRDELIARGHSFRSDTDTEVVLKAYLEYGISCLSRFNGMFAFAIYDREQRRSFLVRDRIGIKPLYYAACDGRLVFGSEIKVILEYPGFKAAADYTGISSYLSYRYPIGDRTLFKNVNSLLPGHYLEVADSSVARKQYWELPVDEERSDRGEAFYIENIRSLLESAVKLRMRSDVPLGAYLSGGLDSSAIVSLMSRFSGEPVKTFTIGFEEEGFNEFAYAQMVADRYRTEHHEITLGSSDYIDTMIDLIRFKDAPLGVPNEPALHVMSRELKKHITVVLSGEGADEIFGGYGRIFRSPYDYQRLAELNAGGGDVNSEAVRLLRENLSKKYGDRKFDSELDHFLYLYNYSSWEDKERFLNAEVVERLDRDRPLHDEFAAQMAKCEGLGHYDKYLWLFEKMHILGLLHRVDMTTMATSVEARVPFVDHRLVEFALSIPIEYKLKWKSQEAQAAAAVCNSDQISELHDIPKYILKKAFEEDLPEEVLWRRKMGFPVPVHDWLGDRFNRFAKEVLLDSRTKARRLFDCGEIEKALTSPELFRQHRFGIKIWMLVNLELWFREYLD
ncbi:MAG: asparagine synthase (glutamine-hydrolyzing) [bacterium]|nr:asparagine synthase (glutamine-hydrolyzing) [bacterium]